MLIVDSESASRSLTCEVRGKSRNKEKVFHPFPDGLSRTGMNGSEEGEREKVGGMGKIERDRGLGKTGRDGEKEEAGEGTRKFSKYLEDNQVSLLKLWEVRVRVV